MTVYVLKRLALLVPLLLGITFVTFSLTKALPGDPVYSLVGERSDPEVRERLRKEIGGDRGVIMQYFGYLRLLLQGEMGRSYYTNRRVMDDIREKFPRTLGLAAAAMLLATPLGIFVGFIAASYRDRAPDRILSAVSVLGMSMPVFWSGLLLMLFISLELKLLPPSGTGGLKYLVLPSAVLAFPAFSTLVRVTRVTVLDVINAPFVRTAKAKGIGGMRILAVHVLRNAMIPVAAVAGIEFGSYLNGAVLTETIFGWDGIGRFTMEGILKRDYPVILGCIIVGTSVFVLVNLAVDILSHAIDPRIRSRGTDR